LLVPLLFLPDVGTPLSGVITLRLLAADFVSALMFDAIFSSGHGMFNLSAPSNTIGSSTLKVAFEPMDDGENTSSEGGMHSIERVVEGVKDVDDAD